MDHDASPDAPWSGLGPHDALALLADPAGLWWLCGGWGIDLWLGRTTRDHADLDLGCCRPRIDTLRSGEGTPPFLRPEIQLLYKARDVRPHDQADFDLVAPRLADSARAWLREALGLVHPGHPWGRALT